MDAGIAPLPSDWPTPPIHEREPYASHALWKWVPARGREDDKRSTEDGRQQQRRTNGATSRRPIRTEASSTIDEASVLLTLSGLQMTDTPSSTLVIGNTVAFRYHVRKSRFEFSDGSTQMIASTIKNP
jgi:hypothetical protein